jgi:hypothetical protein
MISLPLAGRLVPGAWELGKASLALRLEGGMALVARPGTIVSGREGADPEWLGRAAAQTEGTRGVRGRRLVGLDGPMLVFSGGIGAGVEEDGVQWFPNNLSGIGIPVVDIGVLKADKG